jgi:hypothetical protein
LLGVGGRWWGPRYRANVFCFLSSLPLLPLATTGPNHKVLIYIEHHSVCPLVGIGTPPTPLPQASVPPPPGPKAGGAHAPVAMGVRKSQFRPQEKKLSTLPTLGSYLSSLYFYLTHCIAGAGLPNHLVGEVPWDPKTRRSWAA